MRVCFSGSLALLLAGAVASLASAGPLLPSSATDLKLSGLMPDYIVSKMVPVGTTLRVAITNVGKSDGLKVSLLRVLVSDKDKLIADKSVKTPPIPHGQTRWVSVFPLPLQSGVFIRASADSTNWIVEANEGNNSKILILP